MKRSPNHNIIIGLLEVVKEAELNFREPKGIKIGREESITKVVRNMLKANLAVDVIADLAEVSTEFILKVKSEMDKETEL